MKYVANKQLKDELDDLHRGLHLAMDALINQKDYERTEQLLREMDHYLSNIVTETKVARITP
jgi:hypothetical protein